MQPPPLSVTMPTRNRPGLLERALRSVVRAVAPVAEHIEVAVSDGSDDGATGDVVERVLTGWPAGYRYVWNRPALSLVENINRAVEISTGQWVMQLHDDDYLLPGAGAAMLDAIGRAASGESVLMFGVHIVDINGVRRREQTFRRERYLEPREALRRLLRDSSFVRSPPRWFAGPPFRKRACSTPPSAAPPTPTCGCGCSPATACGACPRRPVRTPSTRGRRLPACGTPTRSRRTTRSSTEPSRRGFVPERTIRRWQADFLHQFILAGAYRRLRMGRRAEAREVLRLFELPEVRDRGVSPKWLPVRAAFTAATVGARPKAG